MKNKKLKTEQLSTQTLSPDKIRGEGHQNHSTMLLAFEKFNVLPKCMLSFALLLYTKNIWAVGLRLLLKQMNFLLS